MAKFYPEVFDLLDDDYKKIKPSIEELEILSFIDSILDDSYEVYFRPFFNGFMPFLVIIKENHGFIFIEYPNKNYHEIKIKPEKKYSYQLFGLIDIVTPPESSNIKKQLPKRLIGISILNDREEILEEIKKGIIYYQLFNLSGFKAGFINYLKLTDLRYTANEQINSFLMEIKRYLKPSLHRLEEGRTFNPNLKQKELISSKVGFQRINGVAGTGKTTLLAHRAVYANIRTKSEVLILSYNITIRHYIRYKLEAVRESYIRTDFHVSHYHDFFKNISTQFYDERPQIGDWENVNYFDDINNLPQYNAIIIDEAQDYKREWVDILIKYFLAPNGEFVIFFDENQDIYQRKSLTSFPIPGRPNTLKKSYRLSPKIALLAESFHNKFITYREKMEIEKEQLQLNLVDFKENISYRFFKNSDDYNTIYEHIKKEISLTNSNPDDIAIIGTSIKVLRELEYFFREIKKEKVTRMFESKEEYDAIMKTQNARLNLKNRRRDYKLNNFNLVTGKMKFSTLHSFKGWEIHTVFFILSDVDEEIEPQVGNSLLENYVSPEIIYTGITRARNNLNIINIGVDKYDEFFLHEIVFP